MNLASGSGNRYCQIRFPRDIVAILAKQRHNPVVVGVSLFLEMVFVTVAAIWLIKVLRSGLKGQVAWFTAPSLLIAAAVLPTVLMKRSFAEIGLRVGRLGHILWVLCRTCLVVFAVLFCGVLLLKYYEVQPPLCPVVPENRWFSWLIYQFIYVAVAEEIFFRGYLQSNILRLLTTTVQKNLAFLQLMSIVMAAAVFAISHGVLLGNVISIITFFPGLILGWLFVTTKSLLAPILFHGLANVGYGLIAAALT